MISVKKIVLSLLVVGAPSLLAVTCVGDSVAKFKGITLEGKEFSLLNIQGKKRIYFQLFMGYEKESPECLFDLEDFDEEAFDALEEGFSFVIVHLDKACGANPVKFLEDLSNEMLLGIKKHSFKEKSHEVLSKIHWVLASDRYIVKMFDISVCPIGFGFMPYVIDVDENNVIINVRGIEL